MPVLVQVRLLGWIETASSDESDVVRRHDAVVQEHSQRHPPQVPGRRRLGRVQVSVSVDPDDPESIDTAGEPAHRAHMRTTAAAEDEWPYGKD